MAIKLVVFCVAFVLFCLPVNSQPINATQYCKGITVVSIDCETATTFSVLCQQSTTDDTYKFDFESRIVQGVCPKGTYCAPQYENSTISCRTPLLLRPLIRVRETYECFNVTVSPMDEGYEYILYFSVFDTNSKALAYTNTHLTTFQCTGPGYNSVIAGNRANYHGVNQFAIEVIQNPFCVGPTALQVCVDKVSSPNATIAVFDEPFSVE